MRFEHEVIEDYIKRVFCPTWYFFAFGLIGFDSPSLLEALDKARLPILKIIDPTVSID